MKKLSIKWTKVSIKYKLFLITTALLLALATIIYLFLSFLLPSYYQNYKKQTLKSSILSLAEESKNYDTEYLKYRLYYMARDQNLSLLLSDEDGLEVYDGRYQKYMMLSKSPQYKYKNILVPDNSEKVYETSKYLITNDYNGKYRLDIMMPLQPIDDASHVIRSLMPFVTFLAAFIGIIGAYVYSNTITKPLIEIIEKEREEESRRKEFVATISHELKTPITIISGQIEGMIYNIGKYKDRDTYLKKSYDSTQELKELVDEMMEVSKAEILEKDLIVKPVDISDLVRRLAKRQIFLIEDKGLDLVLKVQDKIIVDVDEEKMTKAINNIINNAIKYSPRDEKIIIRLNKKIISRSYRKSNSIVILEVENTGAKIEDKYLSEIFNPFFRIEKSRSRKTGGSGLGLYIVSKILESHGFNYQINNKDNSVVFSIQI